MLRDLQDLHGPSFACGSHVRGGGR
jgi:hypothetical protein